MRKNRPMAKRALSLEEIASEVGRLFGTTEQHARKWLDQRRALLDALGTVRDKSSALMAQLGDGSNMPLPFGRRKQGRPAKGVPPAPLADTPRKRRGRRKISEESRAKMRAAAQKRWATKRKAAGTKRGSLTTK